MLFVYYSVVGVDAPPKTFTLLEGENAGLQFSGTDAAGNITEYTLPNVITLDTIAPVIAVTSTVPALTNQAKLTVHYTVDGVDAPPQTFTLLEGDNAGLQLRATDAAGNIKEYSLPNVMLDTIAPVIAVRSTVPALTNDPALTITYTVVDGGAVQTKTKTFTLTEGLNHNLTISATDGAGNERVFTLPDVTLDPTFEPITPPAVQGFVDQLSLQLGMRNQPEDIFGVKVSIWPDGGYKILITNNVVSANKLKTLSFLVDDAGNLNTASLYPVWEEGFFNGTPMGDVFFSDYKALQWLFGQNKWLRGPGTTDIDGLVIWTQYEAVWYDQGNGVPGLTISGNVNTVQL